MAAVFEGEGSTRQREYGEECPACGGREVWYVGSDVLHGNPYTPASDTDVEHFYACSCGHRWSKLV